MAMTRQARGWDEIRARLAVQVQPAALTFTGIPLDYWREEVRLGGVALERLRKIVAERGADYEKTVEALCTK
jgi:hypothetical protein